jgi:hypothetical protein
MKQDIQLSHYKTNVPIGRSGSWRIERFMVEEEAARIFNGHSLIKAFVGELCRPIQPGRYTRLMHRDLHLPVMSDTPAELRDLLSWLCAAQGQCLIAGLGLGIAAEMALRKPEVSHVTVIEQSPDVIALVKPYLTAKYPTKLAIVNADIFTWQPSASLQYDAAWMDIWPEICPDNLADMRVLRARFEGCAQWVGCWCERECLQGAVNGKRLAMSAQGG